MIRRRLIITGKVQGVFYRNWLIGEALRLGIDGWVRNRTDGSVEAVVQGPADRVEAIVALARRGSPAARVADVAVPDDVPDPVASGFEQRQTA